MTDSQLNAIPNIILIFLLVTLGYSLLIMIGGKNIFKKANKKEVTVYYPIINLFNVLEITDLSIFFGILFFVPILNVIVISFMMYKLGKVFNADILNRIGLVILPIIFYPLLAFGNKQYKMNDQEYLKSLDTIDNNDIILMTQEEVDKLNKVEDEEAPKVDSIFKGTIAEIEDVSPYKAVKLDLLGMEKLKDKDIQSKINNNSENEKENKDDVEFLDL